MTIAEAAGYSTGEIAPPRRRWDTARTLLGKKLAVLALVYLAIFYTAGIFAPLLAPQDPNLQHVSLEDSRQPPSSDHLLGTDALGRDLLSRVLYSARTTIVFTIVVVITGSLFLGLGLGLLAGYRGGWVDTAIMRTGEVVSSLPNLLLMLAIAAAFRQRMNDVAFWIDDHSALSTEDARLFVKFTIIVVASLPFAWLGTSRIVRSQVLAIRESAYVSAAESMGASTRRIIFRHIMPGVMPVFLVGLSAGMAGIAGFEVALSYIGLGIDPPTASFGNLIADAGFVRTFQQYPHMLLSSAIPVILFFFSWNLLGDALVDLFEPRTQRR